MNRKIIVIIITAVKCLVYFYKLFNFHGKKLWKKYENMFVKCELCFMFKKHTYRTEKNDNKDLKKINFRIASLGIGFVFLMINWTHLKWEKWKISVWKIWKEKLRSLEIAWNWSKTAEMRSRDPGVLKISRNREFLWREMSNYKQQLPEAFNITQNIQKFQKI